jgi:hypothetical protein
MSNDLEAQFIAHLAADLVMERSIEPARIRKLLSLYEGRNPTDEDKAFEEGHKEGLEEGLEDNEAQFDAGFQEGYEAGLAEGSLGFGRPI